MFVRSLYTPSVLQVEVVWNGRKRDAQALTGKELILVLANWCSIHALALDFVIADGSEPKGYHRCIAKKQVDLSCLYAERNSSHPIAV